MLFRLAHRLGIFLASAVAASVLVFAVMRVLPGDPARVALGINASEESVARLRAEFGLDRPLIEQYLEWMGGLIRFDPGREFISRASIADRITDPLLVTLWLAGAAMLLAILIAVPLGMWMAVRHRQVDGLAISALSQVGMAVPAFLAGILLISTFAVRLGWFPAGGWVVPGNDPWGFVRHLALPALSLALVQAAVLARYVRTSVLEVLREDYLRTARAKGLRPGPALVRHGLRNASVPVVTVLGLQLSTLMIGAVVVERVFDLPGLGNLLLISVSQRELLTVQTIVMVLVVLVLLINFLVDALYVVLDPRLRVNS